MVVAVMLTSCASSSKEVQPSMEQPIIGCFVSCKDGWLSRTQHLCRTSRWFTEIQISGQYTTRGVDGTIDIDVWTTRAGDYPKQDVVLGSCRSLISRFIDSREPSERGKHPGEDRYGDSTNPQ